MKTKPFFRTGRFAGFCLTVALSVAFFVISPEIFAETVTSPSPGKLDQRVSLVTGAGSGMGEQIALLFAREGAKVVVVDIDGKTARKTAEAITAAKGEAIAVTADVTKEKDVQNMIDTAVKTWGRLDILINNAGVFDMLIPAGEVSDVLWNRVIDTNLTAPMRAIRAAIPVFEKQKGGVIVNIASIAGYTGARGGGAAYVASKHGLIGLTKNVAYTYQDKNIRCNAVAPGKTATNLRANSEKRVGAKTAHDRTIGNWKAIEDAVTAGHITSRRSGSPDEIAKAVLFLASDDASYVNGSVLTVDGGWTAY